MKQNVLFEDNPGAKDYDIPYQVRARGWGTNGVNRPTKTIYENENRRKTTSVVTRKRETKTSNFKQLRFSVSKTSRVAVKIVSGF